MGKKEINPKSIKKWVAVVIAILSALAGALGESASNVTASLLGIQ